MCTIPPLKRKLVSVTIPGFARYVMFRQNLTQASNSSAFSHDPYAYLVEIWKYDRIAISALGYRYITLKSHKTETVYSSWSFRVPVKVGNLNGPLLNLCVHFGSERSAVAYFCSRFSNVAAGENKKCEIKYYVYPTMRTSREILYGLWSTRWKICIE